MGVLAKAFNSQSGEHRVEVPPSSGTAGALRDGVDAGELLPQGGLPAGQRFAQRIAGLPDDESEALLEALLPELVAVLAKRGDGS